MKPALLLVDLQRDYLASPNLQPSADALVSRIAALLRSCREHRIPAIHIWTTIRRDDDRRLPHWRESNRWMCVNGTDGHEPPETLRPCEGEIIVEKNGFNAFANPLLEDKLRALGCDSVMVAGLHLHACVRTVAVECLERGFQVRVIDGAVASNDPVHAAATRRWLTERCVRFIPANDVLAHLNGSPPRRIVHRSPRLTSEVLFEVPIAGATEVARAAGLAQEARRQWRGTGLSERRRLAENVAERLEGTAAEFARQMATDIGKPISHAQEEIRRTATNIRNVSQRAKGHSSIRCESGGSVRQLPLGVVGVISPWNNPVAIPLGKIIPALVFGNTAVWKPAPAGTRIARSLVQLLHESGLPAGAVQLVTGDHTTAQRIASHDNISAITFTGSIAAGHAMQEICARRVIPLQAELSGNNAAIVWEDADLAHAARHVAWGAFGFAGQRCTANRRVIVQASNFDNFLRELKLAAGRLPLGDPLGSATEIGPVITEDKRDELTALVAAAESTGAGHHVERLHGSQFSEPWAKTGAYAQPVIVWCDQPEHPLVQEETMCPLLVVQRAEDFEHALALCNGVRHGLAAALFSQSPQLQRTFLEEARAGILKINASTAGVDVTLPFGGWKASGIGPPEHGEGDALFYTRMQAVYGADDLA